MSEKLGITAGQEVLLQVSNDGLLVYTQELSVRRLQDWVASHVPAGMSLADELIAERRAEAAKEAND